MGNRFEDMIAGAVAGGYSDLHVTGGHPVVFRKDGRIGFDNDNRWEHDEVDELVRQLLGFSQRQTLSRRLSVDIAKTVGNVRIRLNIFNTVRGLSLAIRLLPGKPPGLDRLNLHPDLVEFCRIPSGLILICGATGCGKSTTIASMVEQINRSDSRHIITLEDPIEYRFVSNQSFIEQRELGTHIPSFDQGLRDVLREDPDVIVVGELRESETIRLTLNAVESGHLVIASLHATNTEDAVYRICNAFPPEGQEIVRTQLASTLAVLIVQQLIPVKKVGFRVPLLSILRGNQSIKGIIRENRLSQIESALQTGRQHGMFSAERYKREYLANLTHLVPPKVNFRPSAEANREIIYESPLVETGSSSRRRPGGGKSDNAVAPDRLPMSYQRDGQYVIDETESVDEVLAQIARSDKSGAA